MSEYPSDGESTDTRAMKVEHISYFYGEWEVLDGDSGGTAVKAVQGCITQRVIQSQSGSGSLQGENQSWLIGPEDRQGDAHIYYTSCWGPNRPKHIGHFAPTLAGL
ncbi:unnamed protein product [Pleuronectes platessa]|uniref:Uncharacterized protein n=1 Tax=Pleuronectes platessa TaxID=8262 RepID=A0A9N7ZCG4_PLEPL|nr:unnamed protein product [Pleuronectes platessa]